MKAVHAALTVVLLASVLEAQTFRTRDKIDLRVGFNLTHVSRIYEYSYSLANGTAAQESVYVFDLRIPDKVAISDLVAPPSWEQVFFPGPPGVIRWIARVDLAPGTSQDGFSYTNGNCLPGIILHEFNNEVQHLRK